MTIIKAGVRIFSDGRTPKDGSSLAVTRRAARMMRVLVKHAFSPADEAGRKALERLDPYALRAKGLDQALTPQEFARALFHINQRRGFKSNRKTDKKDNDSDTLTRMGLMLKTGTVVDATIIAAPSSTKNKSGERDPQMHQTRKGKQWYFGMKAHTGVDVQSGLVHTVVGTPANEADVTQAAKLLHGRESHAWGDAGYQGVDKRQGQRGAVASMRSQDGSHGYPFAEEIVRRRQRHDTCH